MTEQKIRNLLQEVDRMTGRPDGMGIDPVVIRRRAGRRRFTRIAGSIVTAAVLLIALGIWSVANIDSEAIHKQREIASLKMQVSRLQASTDAAVALIHEVLEKERRQDQIDELEAELASIPDPLEEIEKRLDKTAFILVYQADRLYRELNETESAVETYKRVIKLFPRNQWATVARERLTEIENRRI